MESPSPLQPEKTKYGGDLRARDEKRFYLSGTWDRAQQAFF
jgi:hypothetical protein